MTAKNRPEGQHYVQRVNFEYRCSCGARSEDIYYIHRHLVDVQMVGMVEEPASQPSEPDGLIEAMRNNPKMGSYMPPGEFGIVDPQPPTAALDLELLDRCWQFIQGCPVARGPYALVTKEALADFVRTETARASLKPCYILGRHTIERVAEEGQLDTEQVAFVAADELFHQNPYARASVAPAALREQLSKLNDDYYALAVRETKVRELTARWRKEFTVHNDMDQSYAIHAHAVQACAAELEAALAAPVKEEGKP